jgi:hypothetical protein
MLPALVLDCLFRKIVSQTLVLHTSQKVSLAKIEAYSVLWNLCSKNQPQHQVILNREGSLEWIYSRNINSLKQRERGLPINGPSLGDDLHEFFITEKP